MQLIREISINWIFIKQQTLLIGATIKCSPFAELIACRPIITKLVCFSEGPKIGPVSWQAGYRFSDFLDCFLSGFLQNRLKNLLYWFPHRRLNEVLNFRTAFYKTFLHPCNVYRKAIETIVKRQSPPSIRKYRHNLGRRRNILYVVQQFPKSLITLF